MNEYDKAVSNGFFWGSGGQISHNAPEIAWDRCTCAVIPSCSHFPCYSIMHCWAEQKCQKSLKKKYKSKSMKSSHFNCNVCVLALINVVRLDWEVENKEFLLLFSADDGIASQKGRRHDRAAPLLHLISNKIPAWSMSGLEHVCTSITVTSIG